MPRYLGCVILMHLRYLGSLQVKCDLDAFKIWCCHIDAFEISVAAGCAEGVPELRLTLDGAGRVSIPDVCRKPVPKLMH